jgi:hypothetical protein
MKKMSFRGENKKLPLKRARTRHKRRAKRVISPMKNDVGDCGKLLEANVFSL